MEISKIVPSLKGLALIALLIYAESRIPNNSPLSQLRNSEKLGVVEDQKNYILEANSDGLADYVLEHGSFNGLVPGNFPGGGRQRRPPTQRYSRAHYVR